MMVILDKVVIVGNVYMNLSILQSMMVRSARIIYY